MTRHLKFFVTLWLALLSLSAWALPDDGSKNMHIVADTTLFNYKTGFNTYEGNVKVTQGQTSLAAERVTTQSNPKRKIDAAIAYGDKTLAHYWTLPKVGDPIFHAWAKVIKFYPQKSTVYLQGNVLITQGNNSFKGAEIIYNIKDQTVFSPAKKGGRATIIIEPAKLQS